MKFLLVPDSFKGSVSSEEFCIIAEKAIKKILPDAQVLSYPISDGGENSVECLVRILNGRFMPCKVTDSNFFIKTVRFGVTNDIAIISVASCAGLADAMIKNPRFTTTYGVGEQIKMAKTLGKKHVYLCLGGSSTNDAGAGMLCALGAKFYDENGIAFVPTGESLGKVRTMDLSEMYKNIDGMDFTALCDVTNPLLGEKGCSRIYARQKGANDADIELLEENMTKYAQLTSKILGTEHDFSGSGSAGGMGYAVKAFLKGDIQSGIGFFLDSINFSVRAKDCDYIFTGEGRFDNTSIMGKVIAGIMERTKGLLAKLVVFCGKNALGHTPPPIYKVIQVSDDSLSLEENIKNTPARLAEYVEEFVEGEATI